MIPFRTTVDAHGSPNVTMALIVVNIAVFVVQIGLSDARESVFIHTYGLVPAFVGDPDLAARYGIDARPLLTLITNTFLHGSWLHLIFNMWALWLFGVPLEDRLGHWRLLLLYLLCGTAGSVAHLLADPASTIPMLGASGAANGLLAGFVRMFPRERVAVIVPIVIVPLIFHVPALIFAVVWFALQIVPGVLALWDIERGGGIAWWAHVGGFGAGLAITAWFAPRRR